MRWGVGWVIFFDEVKKNVTQQHVDLRINVGLRYLASLDKLTQPTILRYCLVSYSFLSKQY